MTRDELWEACTEPGIDNATREYRATLYIDAVLSADRELVAA